MWALCCQLISFFSISNSNPDFYLSVFKFRSWYKQLLGQTKHICGLDFACGFLVWDPWGHVHSPIFLCLHQNSPHEHWLETSTLLSTAEEDELYWKYRNILRQDRHLGSWRQMTLIFFEVQYSTSLVCCCSPFRVIWWLFTFSVQNF